MPRQIFSLDTVVDNGIKWVAMVNNGSKVALTGDPVPDAEPGSSNGMS